MDAISRFSIAVRSPLVNVIQGVIEPTAQVAITFVRSPSVNTVSVATAQNALRIVQNTRFAMFCAQGVGVATPVCNAPI